MIIGDELRTLRAHRIERHRVDSRMASFAAKWHEGWVHRRFDRKLGPLGAAGPDAIAAAIYALFADDAWVDFLIDSLASAMRDDPFFDPPFPAARSDIHSGLVVYQSDHVTITAGVSRVDQLAAKKHKKRQDGSIFFSGQVGLFKFVKAGGAVLSFWEAPPIGADFSAANAGRCRPTRQRKIADGEILLVDGRRESYVIEHALSNLVIVQAAITADRAPVCAEYDASTGAYLGCNATDDSASRIQMMTTLVRKLGHENAFETLAAFLDHPSFFLRWHVMRELLGIDARASLPHLEEMAAHDHHPDVRATARATLAHIQAASPRRKAA